VGVVVVGTPPLATLRVAADDVTAKPNSNPALARIHAFFIEHPEEERKETDNLRSVTRITSGEKRWKPIGLTRSVSSSFRSPGDAVAASAGGPVRRAHAVPMPCRDNHHQRDEQRQDHDSRARQGIRQQPGTTQIDGER
jgi:hypothetical protein